MLLLGPFFFLSFLIFSHYIFISFFQLYWKRLVHIICFCELFLLIQQYGNGIVALGENPWVGNCKTDAVVTIVIEVLRLRKLVFIKYWYNTVVIWLDKWNQTPLYLSQNSLLFFEWEQWSAYEWLMQYFNSCDMIHSVMYIVVTSREIRGYLKKSRL